MNPKLFPGRDVRKFSVALFENLLYHIDYMPLDWCSTLMQLFRVMYNLTESIRYGPYHTASALRVA